MRVLRVNLELERHAQRPRCSMPGRGEENPQKAFSLPRSPTGEPGSQPCGTYSSEAFRTLQEPSGPSFRCQQRKFIKLISLRLFKHPPKQNRSGLCSFQLLAWTHNEKYLWNSKQNYDYARGMWIPLEGTILWIAIAMPLLKWGTGGNYLGKSRPNG